MAGGSKMFQFGSAAAASSMRAGQIPRRFPVWNTEHMTAKLRVPDALLGRRRDLISLAGPSCMACSVPSFRHGMPGCLRDASMFGRALEGDVRILCPSPYSPAMSSTCLSSSLIVASSAASVDSTVPYAPRSRSCGRFSFSSSPSSERTAPLSECRRTWTRQASLSLMPSYPEY